MENVLNSKENIEDNKHWINPFDKDYSVTFSLKDLTEEEKKQFKENWIRYITSGEIIIKEDDPLSD